jgi:hypothetical protein
MHRPQNPHTQKKKKKKKKKKMPKKKKKKKKEKKKKKKKNTSPSARMTSAPGKRRTQTKKSDADICLALPEAPVFRPTMAEFADPLAYIERIRAAAEPYGLCRIVPPSEWTPPNALESLVDMRFRARVQNLAALDAEARCRSSYVDLCKKYLALIGVVYSDELASIDGNLVDLCLLHRAVRRAGGAAALGDDGLEWHKLAPQIWPEDLPGFTRQRPAAADDRRGVTERVRRAFGLELAIIYRTFVKPWDDFKASKKPSNALAAAAATRSVGSSVGAESATASTAFHADSAPAARRKGRMMNIAPSEPAPKRRAGALGVLTSLLDAPTNHNDAADDDDDDGVAHVMCEICHGDGDDAAMLMCDDCDFGYHCACLTPPMLSVPDTEWYCDSCKSKGRFSEFAFVENDELYTIERFRRAAAKFDEDFFGGAVSATKRRGLHERIEREFWRVLAWENEDETVDFHRRTFEVEYGADLHTTVHGSGFPRNHSTDLGRCGWNLNNLPLLKNSLLRKCDREIDGVIRPWIYIGMMFSSFCWHNEDHYLYSINYLHAGEPKQWFGIAGENATQFEAVIQELAPELFEEQPDLLLQLVTILSPARLVRHGVPVTRLTQNAGDFVVTFPAAYHAGFNLGFNCAEAVNFAPPDWIPYGALCRSMYKRMRRAPVFSFQRLLVDVARSEPSLRTSVWLMPTLEAEVSDELEARAAARADGLRFEPRVGSELVCNHCADLLYFSAVVCAQCSHAGSVVVGGSDAAAPEPESGSERRATCLAHRAHLCACDPATNHTVLFCEDDDALRKLHDDVLYVYRTPIDWLEDVQAFLAPVPTGDPTLWSMVDQIMSYGDELVRALTTVPIAPFAKCEPASEVLERYRIAPIAVEPLRAARNEISHLHEQMLAALHALNRTIAEVETKREVFAALGSGRVQLAVREAKELMRWAKLMPFFFDAQEVAKFAAIIAHADELGERANAMRKRLVRIDGVHNADATSAIADAAELMNELRHSIVPVSVEELAATLERAKWIVRASSPSEGEAADARLFEAGIACGIASAHPLMDALRQRVVTDDGKVSQLVAQGPPYPAGVENMLDERKGSAPRDVYQMRLRNELLRVREWCKVAESELRGSPTIEDLDALLARPEPSLFVRHKQAHSLVEQLSLARERLAWDSAALALFSPVNGSLLIALLKPHVEHVNAKRRVVGSGPVGAPCVCRKPASGTMLRCSACSERFHEACCGAAAFGNSPSNSPRWVCPWCHATRRPPLPDVAALVERARVLGVRTPLMDAVETLVNSAQSWLERATLAFDGQASRSLEGIKSLLREAELLEVTFEIAPRLLEFVITTEAMRAKERASVLVAALENGEPAVTPTLIAECWAIAGDVFLTHGRLDALYVLQGRVSRVRSGVADEETAAEGSTRLDKNFTASYLSDSAPTSADLMCACRQPYVGGDGSMLCQICHETFHAACVGVAETDKRTQAWFMCPECRGALGGPTPSYSWRQSNIGGDSIALKMSGKRQREDE